MPRLPKPESCRGCIGDTWQHPIVGTKQLTPPHTGFSRDEGSMTSGVLVVAEALGQNEDADGLPLRPYAQSGSLFERALKRCGYTRDQFRLTNVVRCRPPHDLLADTSYEFSVIQHCRPNLLQSLRESKPRCILALGGTATRELTGMSGTKAGVSYVRGYVLPCIVAGFETVPVVATFHPSFLRQGKPQYQGVLYNDLQRAVDVARNGVPKPVVTHYQLHPTIDDARAFLRECENNQHLPLTYDIETDGSAETNEDERQLLEWGGSITQIQFSLRVGEGIVFPWEGEYIDTAKDILALRHTKYSFYGHLFDDPRLRAAGVVFGGPYPHDLYEMWHHHQPDLDANLQAVTSFYPMGMQPWKHRAAENMAFYGCCDVDAPQRILAKLPDQLRKRGLWDGYEQLVYHVRPILARMEQRGIPVNDERRRAFGLELDVAAAETDAEMQALVPEACRNVHPKQGYKREPKDTNGMVRRWFDGMGTSSSTVDIGRFHTSNAKGTVGGRHAGTPPRVGELDREPNTNGMVERWCRITPFKPSQQQLIRYMRHRGHPVPVNLKKGRETSEAKELERLARKTHDPLYRKVIWYREVRLMKTTFVDGWAPRADGRVHTTFTFAPAIGQLSSRDPNVQNAPEHEKEGRADTGLADKFQRIMEAPVGYKFVTFDHKSFHALTLAWLANDRDYLRLVRMDVHSYLASQFLKLKPASVLLAYKDDELLDYLKWVKREHRQVRDNKAKRTVLAWGNGQSYRSIYNQYMESFANEREARQLQDTLKASFPVTDRWQQAILKKAHYDTYLVSAFGFIRWFWDVFHFDGKSGQLRHGDQAEQAINYLIANTAFGMMREEARTMATHGYDDRYGLINNVHDAWKFCCADELVDECIHTIKPLMEAPCPRLKSALTPDGLWCAVSVSIGQNMGAKSASNPDGREEVTVHDASAVAALPA